MWYMFRVRLSSFLAGATVASAAGLYFLYKDYRVAQESISRQVKAFHGSLDARVSSLENTSERETVSHLEGSE